MGKTISLKLNSSEEELIHKMLVRGISPSTLLRRALSNYLNPIDEKVYLFQQEENCFFNEKVNRLKEKEVNQVNQKVNLFKEGEVNLVGHKVNPLMEKEVNQVNQKVNRLKEEEVNLEVNQNDFFSENMEEKKVNQKVNLVNQFENKYFDLYVEQLKNRLNQLEKDAQELKDKNKTAEQFLVNNYQIIQEEYHNMVKDTIKRLDDKFDRIMFCLEGSIKKPDCQVNLKSDFKEKHEQNNLPDVIHKKDAETSISIKKPKKGWVFQMYRM
jgi:hypothetical protein